MLLSHPSSTTLQKPPVRHHHLRFYRKPTFKTLAHQNPIQGPRHTCPPWTPHLLPLKYIIDFKIPSTTSAIPLSNIQQCHACPLLLPQVEHSLPTCQPHQSNKERNWGGRAFSVSAPSLWNSPPSSPQSCPHPHHIQNHTHTHTNNLPIQIQLLFVYLSISF